jgi:hypothetical protein
VGLSTATAVTHVNSVLVVPHWVSVSVTGRHHLTLSVPHVGHIGASTVMGNTTSRPSRLVRMKIRFTSMSPVSNHSFMRGVRKASTVSGCPALHVRECLWMILAMWEGMCNLELAERRRHNFPWPVSAG